MPYTLVEEKISQISSEFQQELIDFVDFLLYKQNLQTEKNSISQEKQKKLDALNAISGILTTEESNTVFRALIISFLYSSYSPKSNVPSCTAL